MRKRRMVLAVAALATAVGALAGQAPAGATEHSGTTTVDAVVTQGALTISAQPASATLGGAKFNASLPSQATGQFGAVTISDGRGVGTAWSLTAASTNFVGQTDSTKSVALGLSNTLDFGAVAAPTIGPSATAGSCTVAGGSLTAANTGVSIATGANLLTQLDPTTCSFDPSLTLNIPAGTPAQTYRGTVTLTVA